MMLERVMGRGGGGEGRGRRHLLGPIFRSSCPFHVMFSNFFVHSMFHLQISARSRSQLFNLLAPRPLK